MFSKKFIKSYVVAATIVIGSLAQPAFAAPPDHSTQGPAWLSSWVNWAQDYGGGEWRTLWLAQWYTTGG